MCTVGYVNHSYAQSCYKYIKSSDDHTYCLDCNRNCKLCAEDLVRLPVAQVTLFDHIAISLLYTCSQSSLTLSLIITARIAATT